MSPHILFELQETRTSAQRFERGYRQLERELTNLIVHTRGAKTNERPLVSRNKREGWYFTKAQMGDLRKDKPFKITMRFSRIYNKDFALRYRKQSGAQLMRFRLKGKFK